MFLNAYKSSESGQQGENKVLESSKMLRQWEECPEMQLQLLMHQQPPSTYEKVN
eukprot:TRINITY_DN14650_c0_g1_i1.p4 TRINITY_DN14650_c0_g1~~TRINITY_DN14650_c0_g1_i1.p4  ORF type:complete len:54 (-),score=10.97 TRINITY_DN14650_c0_g1_i1:14-175(-)